MKNISFRQFFTKYEKLLAVCLMIVITNYHHTIQACESLFTIADTLTKSSYNSCQIQKTIAFVHGNTTNAMQNIPSVQDIMAKICEQQNSQGYIKNNSIRKQAIESLNAAIEATDNALNLTYSHLKNKDIDVLSSITVDHDLIDLLSNQKNLLQKKSAEISEKYSSQYYIQPSTTYTLIALAIATAIITSGILYLDIFDLDSPDTSQEPILFTGDPFDTKREELYAKMNIILTNFIDTNDHRHTTVYLNQAKDILKELDPIKDHTIIEMVNTFTESQNRLEAGASGFFNKDIVENACYWKNVLRKEAYYTKILVEVLNHNSNKTKVFTSHNIDLLDVLSQKNKYDRNDSSM